MMKIKFEWDSDKAKLNFAKHGVSFEEAESVFYDNLARIKPDPDHSINEERLIIMGCTKQNRLLIISFTDRNDNIRIINARTATKQERKQYEQYI